MEDPGTYDDEVIPGSDEEENSLIPPISCDRTLLEDRIPPAITQDTIQTPFDATMVKQSPISSISDGTTGSSSATKPRPKPRPLKKRTDMSSSDTPRQDKIATISETPMDADFSMSFDIAERAKMRSRNNKPQTQPFFLPSDIIELSSDDDDDFDVLPPSKRRKATDKTKSKSAKKSKSHSELADTADSKSRPRPRLLKKSNKGENAEQTPPIGAITPNSPIPTSSISNNTYPSNSSQLPPSDPPSSTAGSYDYPPITTLLQTSTDHEPSSPSSLFSSGQKNRKHAMSHIDELDSDPDPLAGDAIDADTCLMPPPPLPGLPPTFFAGSPSLVHDDTLSATSTTSGTRTPAVKKSRKKKLVVNDDEDDSVWVTSKPKAKAKQEKIPAKKVEVVVKQPKAKSKGKKNKGKEKEVLKSREFFDDDDDDDPSDKVSATAPTALETPESLTSMSFIPDYDNDSHAKAESRKRRKSLDREDDEPDAIGRTAGSEYKRRVVDRSKRVIDSDNEDMSAHSNEHGNEATNSPKTKVNAKSQEKPSSAKKASKSSPYANVETNDATSSKQQMGNEKEPQNSSSSKENFRPPSASDTPRTPQASVGTGVSRFPSLSSRYTIAPKTKSTPMSDLIRRVNSKPGSPFRSPAPRTGGASSATPSTAYSPYAKASRTALSRIAPLHPNRRTPPPPPPPPPPKKKTKKELEREEQWEEELIESVGGMTEWACMSDAERVQMRRAKREREMYGWED